MKRSVLFATASFVLAGGLSVLTAQAAQVPNLNVLKGGGVENALIAKAQGTLQMSQGTLKFAPCEDCIKRCSRSYTFCRAAGHYCGASYQRCRRGCWRVCHRRF